MITCTNTCRPFWRGEFSNPRAEDGDTHTHTHTHTQRYAHLNQEIIQIYASQERSDIPMESHIIYQQHSWQTSCSGVDDQGKMNSLKSSWPAHGWGGGCSFFCLSIVFVLLTLNFVLILIFCHCVVHL